MDNKFTNNKYITQQTTLKNYKAVYGGPSYDLHFRYSEFLNVTFISMMYGVGIPLLFPVAVVYMLVAYLCERISIAYIFKQPPAIGMNLTNEAISLLKFAPFFLVSNSMWMLGNK